MKKVYAYVLATAFLFGTMEVALKLAGDQLDAFQLTFARFLLGGILLLPPALVELRRTRIRLDARDWGRIVLLGIICIPISMVLFQLGIEKSNAATAAVLFSVNPLFTMVLAHFFAGEAMTRRKAAAFALALLGILAMMRPWAIQEGNTFEGMAISLLAALFFSTYTILGKRGIQKLGPFIQNSFSFLVGCAVLLPILLLTGRPVFGGLGAEWELVLYTGVFVTGLGYICYFQAIRKSNATTGSVAFFIKPVIAPIFAVLILGESILWNMVLGIALILFASFLQMNTKELKS
jgi:drug/metabolite transporter (DMT)-like permease